MGYCNKLGPKSVGIKEGFVRPEHMVYSGVPLRQICSSCKLGEHELCSNTQVIPVPSKVAERIGKPPFGKKWVQKWCCDGEMEIAQSYR